MINGFLNITSPTSIMQQIADRVREQRLELNLTQNALAKRSGMSLSSYRRFETTGEISLKSLVQLAIVLDLADDFTNLFTKKHYKSIDDVVASTKEETRKRGSRNE